MFAAGFTFAEFRFFRSGLGGACDNFIGLQVDENLLRQLLLSPRFSYLQHKIHLCYWFCISAPVGSVGGKKRKICGSPDSPPSLFFIPHTPQDFQGWSFHYSQVLFPRDLVMLPSRTLRTRLSSSAFPTSSRPPFLRGASVPHMLCSGSSKFRYTGLLCLVPCLRIKLTTAP